MAAAAGLVEVRQAFSHVAALSTLHVSPPFHALRQLKTESCAALFGTCWWINDCDSEISLLISVLLFLGLSAGVAATQRLHLLYMEEQPLKAFVRSWGNILGSEQAGITQSL